MKVIPRIGIRNAVAADGTSGSLRRALLAAGLFSIGLVEFSAAIADLHRLPFGLFWLLIATLVLVPVSAGVLVIRGAFDQNRQMTNQMQKLHEIIVDAKTSGTYRCRPEAVDAWRATETLKQGGVSILPIREMRTTSTQIVLSIGSSRGLVPGMRIGVYDTREGTLVLPLNLEAGMIEREETYLQFGRDRNIADRLLRHDLARLEVHLIEPADSNDGSGELEHLLGRLLCEIEPRSEPSHG